MRFVIDKTTFQDVLQAAINAVPNKSTIQILNNFALRLEGNFLEVSATDLNLGIRAQVEVQGERDGSVVINARKLLEIVKSLVDPSITNVTMDVQDFLATIQWSERGKASITGFDASDFPPFPEVSEGEALNFAASELAFLAEKTAFACSTDTIRLNLNGVYLEAKDGVISMIATDGHRLGRAVIEQEGANLTNGAIIPKKALQLILHMVKPDATVEVRTSATHILFSTGTTQVISKLFEGPYPNYRAVIPQNFERTVQLNTTEFQNKMRSVLAMRKRPGCRRRFPRSHRGDAQRRRQLQHRVRRPLPHRNLQHVQERRDHHEDEQPDWRLHHRTGGREPRVQLPPDADAPERRLRHVRLQIN